MNAKARASVVLLALAVATPTVASAGNVRLIIGFDQTPVTWLLKGRARVLPILPIVGPSPVYRVGGSLSCFDDGAGLCPGRRSRARGEMRGLGDVITLTARFPRGVKCVFSGSLVRNEGSYTCTDRDGNVVLTEPLHVGLCRCIVRSGSTSEVCSPGPCPF
jgi:hypothetical protein